MLGVGNQDHFARSFRSPKFDRVATHEPLRIEGALEALSYHKLAVSERAGKLTQPEKAAGNERGDVVSLPSAIHFSVLHADCLQRWVRAAAESARPRARHSMIATRAFKSGLLSFGRRLKSW